MNKRLLLKAVNRDGTDIKFSERYDCWPSDEDVKKLIENVNDYSDYTTVEAGTSINITTLSTELTDSAYIIDEKGLKWMEIGEDGCLRAS